MVAGVTYGCRGSAARAAQPNAVAGEKAYAIAELGYRRDQSSTYFTFPEWYIVYVAEDFGRFLEKGRESGFAYGAATTGFWRSFCTIKRETAGRAEPNADVATMINVIGVSFSIEYAIKGLYENSIGRATEFLAGDTRTDEDRLAQRVAADYAQFLYATPWYKYPFWDSFKRLWRDTSLVGPAIVRKWERKASLSAEYLLKAGYAWVIQQGLDATSGEDAREIMLVVHGLTEADLAAEPRLRVVRQLDDGATLLIAPRYQVFTDIAVDLSRKGRPIAEIAGNRLILLTAIVPDGKAMDAAGLTEMFAMELAARPGWRRVGYEARVDRLPGIVAAFDQAGHPVEHLFDF